MSKKISDFSQIINRNNDDWLLIEESQTGTYKKIKVSDFIAGVSSSSSADGTTYDPDAQAVITAIQNTGVTLTTNQKEACLARIAAMKNSGVWLKKIAYYGFLGGTAKAHAINWKSPGTYNITWNGTSGHSSSGVQCGGGSSNGDTNYNVKAAGLITTKSHFSMYCLTDSAQDSYDFGIYTVNPLAIFGCSLKRSNSIIYYDTPYSQNRVYSSNVGSTKGYFQMTNDSEHIYVYKNNFNIIEATNNSPIDLASMFDGNLLVFNVNAIELNKTVHSHATEGSTRAYGSASFGLDLTPSQIASEYAAEQSYQQALNRNVL